MSIRRPPPRLARRSLAAVTLVATGALAACGGSSDESTTGSSPSTAGNAPTETTEQPAPADRAEPAPTGVDCPDDASVSDATGADVVRDPASGDDLGCHYYSADDVVSVGIVIEDPTSRTIADIQRNIDIDPVEGVGDAAYSMVTPGGIVQFGVFSGSRHVLVTIQGVDPDPSTARAVYDLFA